MIQVAISPCPNDIFNFYGLLTKKVSCDVPFEIKKYPLHELNKYYREEKFDFLKVSFMTYLQCQDIYKLCHLGHSFASQKGPVIFSRKNYSLEELKSCRFASAGPDTSAHHLLQVLFDKPETVIRPFNEIISAIQKEEVDAGVVINESRVKASAYGLYEICDLTKLWVERFHLPTPLGAFVAKKNLDDKIYHGFLNSLLQSIEYAKAHQAEAFEYASEFSQEKDLLSIEEHVKNFSLNQEFYSKEVEVEAVDFFKRTKVDPLLMKC